MKYAQSHNDAQSWVIPSNKSDDYISPGKTPLVTIVFSSKPSHLMTSATLHLFTREQRSSLDRKSSLLKTWPRIGESPLSKFTQPPALRPFCSVSRAFYGSYGSSSTIETPLEHHWNPLSFPFVVHSMAHRRACSASKLSALPS